MVRRQPRSRREAPFVPARRSEIPDAIAMRCPDVLEPAHPHDAAPDSQLNPGRQSRCAGFVSARPSREKTRIGAQISTLAQKAPPSSPDGVPNTLTLRS
jgi:hypothetical protein